MVFGYKQRTSTGFGDLRRKPNLSKSVKDVGNDKDFSPQQCPSGKRIINRAETVECLSVAAD